MSSTSKLFHVVEDGRAILRRNGVFHQTKLYERCGELYAGWGSGFVGLRKNSQTTSPDIILVDVETPRGTCIAYGTYGVFILARQQ